MSIAPLPATLEQLSGRRFAFYPPIRNIARNEWIHRRTTWSECIVANLEDSAEYSIPRQYVGDVSVAEQVFADQPATVVELERELEWRNGSIRPFERRVIVFPVNGASDEARLRSGGRPGTVVSIRLETATQPTTRKKIAGAILLTAVLCAVVAGVLAQPHRRADTGVTSRAWLQLNASDDYRGVLSKLGTPGQERTSRRDGKTQRILVYPGLRFYVVLEGPGVTDVHYKEAIDFRGQVLGTRRAALPIL